MKNWLLVGASLIAIGASVWLVMGRGDHRAALRNPPELMIRGACLACKSSSDFMVKSSEHEPYACPSCAKEAVYRWWYCEDCKKRTIPILRRDEDKVLRVPPWPTCPKCHCTNLAMYEPAMPGQSPMGDNALPKWP